MKPCSDQVSVKGQLKFQDWFLIIGWQESFWRIPAKISPSQLRSAASSLSPSENQPDGGEELEGQSGPTEEPQDEPLSSEQRTQALRALLLERKRKHHTTEGTGAVNVVVLSSAI